MNIAEFEMFVQRELNHKNIVKYITGFIDETGPWGPTASLYLEFCDKGNLYDYVVKRYSTGHLIPEMWIWDVFVQLVDAVAFMQYGVQNACRNPEEPGHWIGVVHRDIKLDNIFLCSIPGSSKVRACLGDFGQAIREDDDGNWGRQYMGGNLGTAPPEVQQGGFDLYSYEGDVWALGCCISAMCQPGVEPALMQLAGPYYSESLSLAINYLMQYDARDRPNMIEFASNMLEWRRQGLGPRPYSYTY